MRFTNSCIYGALIFVGTVLAIEGHAQSAVHAPAPRLSAWPRDLEVRLALSAAPPHLRAEAAVYVLDPLTGYVLARPGTNGFTCYVERTDYTREFFRDDYVVPECQDSEGSASIVAVEFDVERLRAQSLSPKALKAAILRGFQTGVYRAPHRPGIAYMLAPLAQLNGGPGDGRVIPMNMPHVMFFAPNLTARDVGAGPVMGPYPYIIGSGPMAYVIVNLGETEKARITQDSQELLKDLCEYRAALCLSGTAHRSVGVNGGQL